MVRSAKSQLHMRVVRERVVRECSFVSQLKHSIITGFSKFRAGSGDENGENNSCYAKNFIAGRCITHCKYNMVYIFLGLSCILKGLGKMAKK